MISFKRGRIGTTHELVLVRGDGGEGGFGEDERLASGSVDVVQTTNCHRRVDAAADHVHARLVLVHRVQYDLQHAHRSSTLACSVRLPVRRRQQYYTIKSQRQPILDYRVA